MQKHQEIERSIITRYRKDIYAKFVRAINKYELIKPNDKIMVCISGGKDSFLLAKCMEEFVRHGKIPCTCKYVVMNPGYKEINLNKIKENANILKIDIEIFESDIFDVVNNNGGKSPCYLCARMRRGYLYNKAQELGCNKIALGHHFDDVIETTLLSMFYGSEIKTMMPKLHSDNFEGLELIRPLCLVKEKDIISWCKSNELEFINCACKFTDDFFHNKVESKREEIKKIIKGLKNNYDEIDNNIYKSLENVNFNCIIGGHKDGKEYSFLDEYDK